MYHAAYWIGLALGISTLFTPLYGGKITAEAAAHLVQHEREHTWVINTQKSEKGLTTVENATDIIFLHSPMIQRKMINDSLKFFDDWLSKENQKKKPDSTTQILLFFSATIEEKLQIALENATATKFNLNPAHVHRCEWEEFVQYAASHELALIPFSVSMGQLFGLKLHPQEAAAAPRAAAEVHSEPLPISEIHLPAEFSFGLPSNFKLYLGTATGYWNKDQVLKENHITHTVSLVDVDKLKPNPLPPGYLLPIDHQLHITNLDDRQTAELKEHIPDVIAFLQHASTAGTVEHPSHVFVHCQAGISRSPSMIIAFLLHARYEYLGKQGRRWDEYTPTEEAYLKTLTRDSDQHRRPLLLDYLLRMLQKDRSVISPNLGFMGQLMNYEKHLKSHLDREIKASKTHPSLE